MPRRFSSIFAAFAALFLTLVTTSRASAQTISVAGESSLARLDASGQPVQKRPLFLNPEAINAQDCKDDQKIRLPVQMTGFQAAAKVEIWASLGADCSSAPNRAPETGACWSLVPAVPLQSAIDVDIPVRALISPASDETQCGKVDITEIDVQILYFAPGEYSTAAAAKHLAILADTVGPEPPRAAISAGNGRAQIALMPTGEINDFVQTTAYCETSAAPDACTSTALVPAAEPPASFECGRLDGNGGGTFFTEPLENGTNHVVAIAALDAFGNLGPLSSVTCVTPSPDAETRVQGLDEPTGCSVGAIGRSHVSSGPAAVLVVALGVVLGSCRRRGRSSTSARVPQRVLLPSRVGTRHDRNFVA